MGLKEKEAKLEVRGLSHSWSKSLLGKGDWVGSFLVRLNGAAERWRLFTLTHAIS